VRSAVIRNDIFALGDAGQILRGKLITKVRQRGLHPVWMTPA
jgi:hypothetical protein